MSYEQPEEQQDTASRSELTPKDMYRELSRVFHADAGGEHDLMVELNLAYEKARKNDARELIKLYEEWASTKKEEGVVTPKELLNILQKISDDSYEQSKKKRVPLSPRFTMNKAYIEYYKKKGIVVDPIKKWSVIGKILLDDGWITEEEFAQLNKLHY